MAELLHVTHEFPALFAADSRVLILGSIPSPKSREAAFYYGHPQNRFWRVMAEVLGEERPASVEEKKELMLRHRIALWDVLAECDIAGASDTSIKNPVANDMNWILKQTKIQSIYTTGATAHKLYEKLCFPECGIHAVKLPSTSPANCAVKYEQLVEAYRQIVVNAGNAGDL